MERLNDVNECRMKFGLSSVFHEMTKSEYELCLCYQFLLTASSFLYSIQKKNQYREQTKILLGIQ